MAFKITTGFKGREQTIIDLFAATFAASEGEDEGELIRSFVHDLLAETSAADIRVFCAEDGGHIVGAVVFTRLTYLEDPHIVFILSPMAVAAEHQRQGIGLALLTEALKTLRSEGIQVAVTYGDPNYYKKVGFTPITEEQARAPLPLSLPHGWIGRSLVDEPMPVLRGPSTCVSALNRADLW